MDTAKAVAMDTATAVAAGAAFSCALMLDGAVFCWGDNHDGQLATGSGTLSALPAPVPAVTNATAIAAGGAHTCATIDAGSGTAAAKPVCWGADQAGQLGDAKAVDRAQSRPIQAEVRASAIAAGEAHSCALDGTTVWCWGRGADGQLGSGSLADKSPTPVATLPAVTAVSAGGSHTCTIAAERVRCFGANGSGQLGDGTTTNRSEPAAAPLGADPATPARIAAGGAHTCAVDTDGHVWCWGNGEEGAVGDGSGMDRPAPVALRLGSDGATAQAIAAGGAHTCAVTTAGQLYCWGRGDEGQLGAGDTVDALDPTLVPAISGVVDVAAGGAHTCAIVGTERAVWCWGDNDSGQLGNGMTEVGPTETPTPVAGLTGVQALSAGAAHTCALRSDRTVWCWGTDSSGQLGDGVPLYVNTPQLARLACR
jgi:alpha-tubulin suppressor-like RCC1 family protein